MEEARKTLLVCEITQKTSKDYKKKYCHPNMHPQNYVICSVMGRTRAQMQLLESGDAQEWARLKQDMADRGLHGEFIIKKALGGPGKRKRGETKAQWRNKRESGFPEIARVRI